MERKFSELQVGVLTIFALVVLIVGMMWLKGISHTRGEALYQVDFDQVEGLRIGDRVQVRGIRMGEVSNMQMLQESVRVELTLDEAASLREDAQITLGEKGIVGEIVIGIDPGVGASVAEGHIFVGRSAGTIANMTDAAGAALEEMRVLTSKVTDLVDEVKSTGMIVETLAQANETVAKIDVMIEENHLEIAVILDNVHATSESLRRIIESGLIEDALTGVAGASTRADSLMVSLDASAVRLEAILAKIDEGEGTAAKLLNDPMLYDRADSTMASIKRLVDAMRRNPKRHLRLNVVDF